MNNEIKLDLRKLSLLFYNFRYSSAYSMTMPIVIIGVSILVIWIYIVPQIQQWFSIQSEIQATQQRIATIQNNIQYLQLVNSEAVDSDFVSALKALPDEKDLVGILDAVSQAALESQVITHDYSFSVGTVLQKEGTQVQAEAVPIEFELGGFVPIRVVLTVEGNGNNIAKFIKAIEEEVPLSEIKSVEFTEEKAQVTVSFFSRPLPKLPLNEVKPVDVLTNQDKDILKKIKAWE